MLSYVFLTHISLPYPAQSPQEIPNEWIIEIYNLEDFLKKIFKKHFNKNMQLNRYTIASKLHLTQVM